MMAFVEGQDRLRFAGPLFAHPGRHPAGDGRTWANIIGPVTPAAPVGQNPAVPCIPLTFQLFYELIDVVILTFNWSRPSVPACLAGGLTFPAARQGKASVRKHFRR